MCDPAQASALIEDGQREKSDIMRQLDAEREEMRVERKNIQVRRKQLDGEIKAFEEAEAELRVSDSI